MRRLPALLLFAWLCALVAAVGAADLAPVPRLAARVTDTTGTLNAQQVAALESDLAAFEREKGAQITVLVVPTTQPEPIEAYGIRVAEAWKIGRKGVDDGVIVIVALNDRRLRIEVGYGLEGVIPDAVAKRIISEVITPRFKAGDIPGGIAAGVQALERVIAGEQLPPARHGVAEAGGDGLQGLFTALVVAGIAAPFLRAILGRLLGGLLGGGAIALLAWMVTGSLLLAIGAGVIMGLIIVVGRMGGGRGGWSSGGGGWGRSSGGGFGGGGFSGGGGGFGGGGASGRW